jgi:hypothetical protein
VQRVLRVDVLRLDKQRCEDVALGCGGDFDLPALAAPQEGRKKLGELNGGERELVDRAVFAHATPYLCNVSQGGDIIIGNG